MSTKSVSVNYAAALVFCAVVFVTPSFAQTSMGRISGTVTDSSDASVIDAKVTVVNVDTRASRTAATESNGFYTVTNLPIGNYTVEVAKEGFKTASHSGVQLSADARISVDFRLEVGNLTQTVEVTAQQTEQVNAVSGEVSRVIDSHQVDNLTMNGRNYVQLMTMVPGAIVTNPDQFSTTTSLASNNQTINGNRGGRRLQLRGRQQQQPGQQRQPRFHSGSEVADLQLLRRVRPLLRPGLQHHDQERHQPVPRRRF
jgi:hypothetical protein